MGKLSTGRSFGGIFLILIGFLIVIIGIITLMFRSTDIIGITSIFLTNLPSLFVVVGLIHIAFGLFLIWAGRTIRNEPFIPDFIRRMMS